jgi:hypothetical protein
MMLACWASWPLDRAAPSRSMRTGVPANPEDNLNHFSLFCFGTLENALKYKVYWCNFFFRMSLWAKNGEKEFYFVIPVKMGAKCFDYGD